MTHTPPAAFADPEVFLLDHPPPPRPWDGEFARWVAISESSDRDPNDVGDDVWNDDPLRHALDRHYLPHVMPGATVLELGPGTGRATRHLIDKCARMVLVDFSRAVCLFLARYLRGKGAVSIHEIDRPAFPRIAGASIDVAIANGELEHVDVDDLSFFMDDFHRVLRPGGVLSFNFDSLMTREGIAWHRQFRGHPGDKCIFRFHHPDVVAQLAEASGLEVLRLTRGSSRFVHIELKKR